MSLLKFTPLMIWAKFQFTCSLSIPELLLVSLLEILVVADLYFTIVFKVHSTVGDFMEGICKRCELISWLHLVVARFLIESLRWRPHKSVLHWLEHDIWHLPKILVSVEDLVTSEGRGHIPLILFAIVGRDLQFISICWESSNLATYRLNEFTLAKASRTDHFVLVFMTCLPGALGVSH